MKQAVKVVLVALVNDMENIRELHMIIHVLVKKLGGVVSIDHNELINANYDLQVIEDPKDSNIILKVRASNESRKD